eukprot:3307826-Pleurochrysis_carterae.AAC.1
MTALKEQVRIRVQGLGWANCAIAWSDGGKELTENRLLLSSARMQFSSNLRSRRRAKRLPSLGKRTADVARLDAIEKASSSAAEGVGNSAQERQPVSAPVLDAGMVGKRLVVC